MAYDADKKYKDSTIGKYVPKHKEKEIRSKQAEWHKRFPGKAKTKALEERTKKKGRNPFGDERRTDPRIG